MRWNGRAGHSMVQTVDGEFRKLNSIKMQPCFILPEVLDNLNLGLGDRLSLTKFQQTALNCWECERQWTRGSWWALGRLTWPWEASKLCPAHNCSAQSSCSERKKIIRHHKAPLWLKSLFTSWSNTAPIGMWCFGLWFFDFLSHSRCLWS